MQLNLCDSLGHRLIETGDPIEHELHRERGENDTEHTGHDAQLAFTKPSDDPLRRKEQQTCNPKYQGKDQCEQRQAKRICIGLIAEQQNGRDRTGSG
jgi:hypothetical protein